MKRTLVAVFATLTLACLPPSAWPQDWVKQYPEVTFGVTGGENQQDAITRWQPACDYLSEQLRIKFKLRTASDYAGIIEAMGAGKVEFAWYGGAGYAAAYDITGGNVEALAMDVSSQGNLGYHSVIVVKGDSPFQKLEDLRGKSLAFADPNSTSGYMVPSTLLAQQGLLDRAKPFFSTVGFSGSHENGVIAVINGTYDAAATWAYDGNEGNLQSMVTKGMIKPDAVRIIWRSPLIPNSPFSAVKSLPDGLKQAFKQALLDFHKKDPARFAQVTKGMFGGFAPAKHEQYQYAIDIREAQKKERRRQ
jgi:phosphonate transport system substrate-binding protein